MIFVNEVSLPIAQAQGVLSRFGSTSFLPPPHILNSENGVPTTIPMGTHWGGVQGYPSRKYQAEVSYDPDGIMPFGWPMARR